MLVEVLEKENVIVIDWGTSGNLYSFKRDSNFIVMGNGNMKDGVFEGTVISLGEIKDRKVGEFSKDFDVNKFDMVIKPITLKFIP